MKDRSAMIETLFGKVESYLKTSLEVYRLKAIDKATEVFSTVASSVIIGVIGLLCFALLSIGFALFLGDLLGKSYYGFFALGGFYGVVAIIAAINKREWLEVKLNDFLIKQIFKEKDDASH